MPLVAVATHVALENPAHDEVECEYEQGKHEQCDEHQHVLCYNLAKLLPIELDDVLLHGAPVSIEPTLDAICAGVGELGDTDDEGEEDEEESSSEEASSSAEEEEESSCEDDEEESSNEESSSSTTAPNLLTLSSKLDYYDFKTMILDDYVCAWAECKRGN